MQAEKFSAWRKEIHVHEYTTKQMNAVLLTPWKKNEGLYLLVNLRELQVKMELQGVVVTSCTL